LSSAYHPKTDG
jgi:hypothetical protein